MTKLVNLLFTDVCFNGTRLERFTTQYVPTEPEFERFRGEPVSLWSHVTHDNNKLEVVDLPPPLPDTKYLVDREVYIAVKLLYPDRTDLFFPSGEIQYGWSHGKGVGEIIDSFTELGWLS